MEVPDDSDEVNSRREAFRRVAIEIRDIAIKQHLPIGVVLGFLLGAVWPAPGVFFADIKFQYVCVVGISFISGLKLKTDDIKDALKAYRGVIWGLLSILLVTGLVGIELTKALSDSFSDPIERSVLNSNVTQDSDATCGSSNSSTSSDGVLGPAEFNTGLQVFFASPCTIASGIVIVTQFGGNHALSLLLTVVANLTAVGTIAPLLSWRGSFGDDATLKIVPLVTKLLLTILLPLLVGKALRFHSKVPPVVKRYKKSMTYTSNFFLTILPWMKISSTQDSGLLVCAPVSSIAAIFAFCTAVHVLFLLINGFMVVLLRMELVNAKAVLIQASQKSLSVSLSVLSFLPESLGQQGLLAIPCIMGYFGQLLLDTVLTSAWLTLERRSKLTVDAGELPIVSSNELVYGTQPRKSKLPSYRVGLVEIAF